MSSLKIALVAVLIMFCAIAAAWGQEDAQEPEIREYDHVFIKTGGTQSTELIGTIVRRTETHIYIRLRDYNTDIDTPIERTLIVDIKERTTPLMAFNIKRSKVAVGDFKACFDLARWSLQFPELREKAKTALRDCIKIKPEFLDAYLLLSDLLHEEYRKASALTEEQLNLEIELYRHAIDSGVSDPRVFYRYGLAVRKAGLPRASLEIFKAVLESNETLNIPDMTTWARQEIGELLIEIGKPEEALKELETVLASAPDDFRSLLGRGEARLMLGDLTEAGVALTQAATVDPYFPKPFALLGTIAYMKGELPDAEVWLGRAQAVGLPDAVVLTTLGLVHARMGKFTSAATELAQALTTDPGCWQAEMTRGYLAENEGKTEDAISAYLRALQIKKASGMAHFKLAGAYYGSGEKDLAISELNTALGKGYRPVEVFKFLGRIHYEREEYDVASRYLRYSIAADDKDADAHYLLAMSCLKLKLTFLAQRHFQKAVDLNPAHVGALNGLGFLSYTSGDFKAATALFMSVLTANPKDYYASGGITKINQILNWDCWEDNFKRPDFDDVSNGWKEEERNGIEISIESNSVRFAGIQGESGKMTYLSRVEDGGTFARIEATLNGLQAAGARFGLRIEKRDSKGEIIGGVVLLRDLDGSLAYNYTEEKGKWKSPVVAMALEPFPLDTSSHVFGINITDSKTGTLELLLDGRRIGEPVVCTPLARSKELVVGIYGKADGAVPWTLTAQKVCIFRYRKESQK